MSKPPASILSGDEVQSLGNGLLKGFSAASIRAAQQGLHFGKGTFNGRQIGRVGWQKQQATAGSESALAGPELPDESRDNPA